MVCGVSGLGEAGMSWLMNEESPHVQELKKGPIRNAQQSSKGAGAGSAQAGSNVPVAQAAPVGESASGSGAVGGASGRGKSTESGGDSMSDTESVSSSVSSGGSVRDEL